MDILIIPLHDIFSYLAFSHNEVFTLNCTVFPRISTVIQSSFMSRSLLIVILFLLPLTGGSILRDFDSYKGLEYNIRRGSYVLFSVGRFVL